MAIPGIPQNLYITTGNGKICLNWKISAGATTYPIQRSTDGVTFTPLAAPATNFYLDIAVTIGTQYWYKIAAANGSDVSSYASVGTNGQTLQIVPCAPGQINLGYLRYMSKLRANKLRSQFLTDDEWNFNINQSAKKLYDFLTQKFGENYFLAPPVQIPTSNVITSLGLSAVPLPDGTNYTYQDGSKVPRMFKLAGVDVSVNAGNGQWFTLPRFNWIDRNRYSTLQLSGTVQSIYGLAYCEYGENCYLIPTPQAAQFIQLWIIPLMTEMLLDTDMMPFSLSGWSELVIVDAAIKALVKEESYDQAQALASERSGILDRIEQVASNRDVGQPNTISNTRARAGDPNFGSFGGFGSSGFGNGFGWGG